MKIVCYSLLACAALLLAACGTRGAPEIAPDELNTESSGCNYVFLRSATLRKQLDPTGPFRDPEIQILSKVGSTSQKVDLSDVNHEGVKVRYRLYLGYSCDNALFYFNERDAGGTPVTAAYKGVSLGVEINNNDDFVGAIQRSLRDMRFWPTTTTLGGIAFEACAVPFLSRAKHEKQKLEAVKHLQRRLGFSEKDVDGYFGPRTEYHVTNFQKRAFPDQPGEWDGKVGPQTWGKLGC